MILLPFVFLNRTGGEESSRVIKSNSALGNKEESWPDARCKGTWLVHGARGSHDGRIVYVFGIIFFSLCGPIVYVFVSPGR